MTNDKPIVFLTLEAATDLHRRMIELYGGDASLRDSGLLESALAQPQAMFGGVYLHETIPEMAAAYCYHLVANHAFVDGNKRIGAYAAFVFLDMNGWSFTATQDEYEKMILSVASGELDKEAVTAFFQKHARLSEGG